jgi:hypothetical protein
MFFLEGDRLPLYSALGVILHMFINAGRISPARPISRLKTSVAGLSENTSVVQMRSEPQIELIQAATERDEIRGAFRIIWLLKNLGSEPLRVFSVNFPHQQFKSEEIRFKPSLALDGGAELQFQVLIRCDEPRGLVTENAFAIFRVDWRTEARRVFVRLKVIVDADGKPRATTESISEQNVGFSGVDS